MKVTSAPSLSVVVVTTDSYESVRRTVQGVSQQTVREAVQLIIVVPSCQRLDLIEELAGFHSVVQLEVGTVVEQGPARAAGARSATAPIVAFLEDHVFPQPDWAEALIEAHREPWAAVGPIVLNANPDTMVSWTQFLLAYGEFSESNAGVVDTLPGRNCSFKRDLLAGYGPELDVMMDAETALLWDLRRAGHQLYLEPKARIGHLNMERLRPWLLTEFHGGRVLASTRAHGWSIGRRLVYLFGSPLIPLVRAGRVLAGTREHLYQHRLLPRVLPWLMLGLVASALGEMVGYAAGKGAAGRAMMQLETHRDRFLRRGYVGP